MPAISGGEHRSGKKQTGFVSETDTPTGHQVLSDHEFGSSRVLVGAMPLDLQVQKECLLTKSSPHE